MSPRLNVRAAAAPLVIAGALWGGSPGAPGLAAAHVGAAGNRGQTPPPCSADGLCIPRPQTYGVYWTRWRTFPGDVAVRPPTEAERRERPEVEDRLEGMILPEPTEEGQIGPQAPARRGAGEGGPALEEGATPSDIPLPGIGAPPAQPPTDGAAPFPPPAEGAQPPAPPADVPRGPEIGPGSESGDDPLDPFGTAPPKPPAWLSRAVPMIKPPAIVAATKRPPALPPVSKAPVLSIQQAPIIRPTSIAMPVTETAAPWLTTPSVVDGPNLHGDDAPPGLPAALKDVPWTSLPSQRPQSEDPSPLQPSLVQPASVRPQADSQVTPASAAQPVGIQLVNPAAAIIVDPGEDGLQQAIYFEASDQ